MPRPGDRLRCLVEVGDHDGHERMAGLRRVLQEVEPAVLADRRHGLDVVGEELAGSLPRSRSYQARAIAMSRTRTPEKRSVKCMQT